MQWDPVEEDDWDPDREMEELSANTRQRVRGEQAARDAADKGKTRLLGKKVAAESAKKAREHQLAQKVFEEKSGITKASPPYEAIKKFTGLGRRKTHRRKSKRSTKKKSRRTRK